MELISKKREYSMFDQYSSSLDTCENRILLCSLYQLDRQLNRIWCQILDHGKVGKKRINKMIESYHFMTEQWIVSISRWSWWMAFMSQNFIWRWTGLIFCLSPSSWSECIVNTDHTFHIYLSPFFMIINFGMHMKTFFPLKTNE